MKPNDITVVVRSCGRPVLLQRALASIVVQTLPPVEIVVVTIGTVGAGAVAALKNPPPMKLVAAAEGRSRGGALNDGIAAAGSRWVAFLDDDDTWAPQFLERVSPLLIAGDAQPGFGGVVTQTMAVFEKYVNNAVVEKKRSPFNSDLRVVDLAALAVGNRFTLNAMVVRREVFAAVGNYREDLPVLEDWEFNVRAASRFHFEVISEPLVRYHRRVSAGPLANTSLDEHRRVAIIIRNEWLRADLAAGRVGLGQLALAGETRGMSALLDSLRVWRNRFRGWLGFPPR
jgi:glycosyltransferase involved in cell wall biosynthesis